MSYQYTYIGDEPRDFPTIGYRNVQKGDTVESEEPLFSSFLVDKNMQDAPAPTEEKGE